MLGRIITVLFPGGGNDLKALEQLQALEEKKKQDRKTRIEKNARYVIKASDAMTCVEEQAYNGGLLLTIGKALLNTVRGSGGLNAPDLLTDRIFTCIESKVLKQTGRRHKKEKKYYGRPARGHGHGRGRTATGSQP